MKDEKEEKTSARIRMKKMSVANVKRLTSTMRMMIMRVRSIMVLK